MAVKSARIWKEDKTYGIKHLFNLYFDLSTQ